MESTNYQSIRHQAVLDARQKLLRQGYPRLQMFLLVSLTGGAGFLASFCLLLAGVEVIWQRYLLSVFIAYTCFLGLLWCWLRTSASDYVDLPLDAPLEPGYQALSSGVDKVMVQGKGGSFDGGGATGNFDAPMDAAGDAFSVPADGPLGDALGAVASAEEAALPLAAIVLIIAALLSSLLVVYSAPLLFAELIVDGVLAASLYKRLRHIPERHWLQSAFNRTFWPFAATAGIAATAGGTMALLAPGATTFGAVLIHLGK